MRTLGHDLVHGLRQLLRRPVLTASALLSLAIGIGVNATVFGVANAILFQRPRAADPGSLVRIYVNAHSPFRHADYRLLKEDGQSFSHVIGEVVQAVSFSGPAGQSAFAEAELARAGLVSGDYFEAMGLRPAAGDFPRIEREDAPSAVPQVVLSHAFWSSRFGRDASIIGRSVRLNDRAFVVAGVAPAGFTTAQVLWAPDMYVSMSETPVLLGAGPQVLSGSLYLTARLRPGVTREAAGARVAQLFAIAAEGDSARLARQSWRVDQAVGAPEEMRGPVTAAAAFLLAVATLVLLVACFNVGNLMLAGHAARAREFAVRTALGATRWRVVRQLLVELGLLAAAGAAIALLATRWTTSLVAGIVPEEAGMRLDAGTDAAVLLFTVALVLLVLVVAGLVPAIRSTSGDLTATLRDGTTGSGLRRTRLRRAFLGLQVAVSTVLVVLAGLFVQGLRRAGGIDTGIATAGILDARLDFGRGREDAATIELLDRVHARIAALPGIDGVTATSVVPLTASNSGATIHREGDAEDAGVSTYLSTISPDYFATMRLPLLAGREFTAADGPGATPVMIVNETLAARYWPGQSALGKRLSIDGPAGPWREVIGVSRAIKYHTLGESPPDFLYLPFAQNRTADITLQVRLAAGASEAALARDIVTTVARLDASVPPPRVRTLDDDQRIVLLPARMGAAFTGFLGALGLLLAAVGIFGVAAFEVAQRTRELGIRSALGAPVWAMLRSVLGDTLLTVGLGGAAGLGLALAAAQLVKSQLYGTAPADPLTFLATPLVLVLVAVAATFVPARRVTAMDPAEALRSEG
jgi:putative ABC transport system permease protein